MANEDDEDNIIVESSKTSSISEKMRNSDISLDHRPVLQLRSSLVYDEHDCSSQKEFISIKITTTTLQVLEYRIANMLVLLILCSRLGTDDKSQRVSQLQNINVQEIISSVGKRWLPNELMALWY